MPLELLQRINWVDLLLLLIFIRVIYIALNKGLAIEIFKFFGTLTAIYLSLHYYTVLSDLFRGKFAKTDQATLQFVDLFYFLFLVGVGYSFFLLLRVAFNKYMKIETVSGVSMWGGCIIGFLRGYLLVGLISYSLFVTSTTYLRDMVKGSLLGPYVFHIAPDTYAGIWGAFGSKLMAGEEYNKTVLEVDKDFNTSPVKGQ